MLLQTGTQRLDCIKRDHFKETRCARAPLRNQTPITSSTLSSLSKSLWRLASQIYSPKGDDVTSLVWLSVRSRAFPPRLIHTPRRQSEIQTDWRQTNKARRNGRRTGSLLSAAAGCGRGGGGQHTKPGADHCLDTDWILMLITTVCSGVTFCSVSTRLLHVNLDSWLFNQRRAQSKMLPKEGKRGKIMSFMSLCGYHMTHIPVDQIYWYYTQ